MTEQTRSRDLIASAMVVVIAIASLAFGVLTGTAGDLTAMRYSLLFGLIMALAAALGARMRRSSGSIAKAAGTVDLGPDGRGTEIRYSRVKFGMVVALMTCCAMFFVLAAAETFSGHREPGVPGAGLFLGAIGLALASFPISVALGHLSRGGLVLSNRGVFQRGWSFESRLNWADVAGVKPGYNGHRVIMLVGYTNANWDRRYTTRLWRIDRLPPVPMIEVDCRKFDVDPAVLLSFLSAYINTPDNRAELGTSAAQTRAQHSGRPD